MWHVVPSCNRGGLKHAPIRQGAPAAPSAVMPCLESSLFPHLWPISPAWHVSAKHQRSKAQRRREMWRIRPTNPSWERFKSYISCILGLFAVAHALSVWKFKFSVFFACIAYETEKWWPGNRPITSGFPSFICTFSVATLVIVISLFCTAVHLNHSMDMWIMKTGRLKNIHVFVLRLKLLRRWTTLLELRGCWSCRRLKMLGWFILSIHNYHINDFGTNKSTLLNLLSVLTDLGLHFFYT